MDIVVSDENYVSCCRTCLYDGSEEMYDIFDHNREAVNIHEMLATYASLRVVIDDQLPKKLCSSCYNCLLSFHNFTNIALNADMKLREYFSNNQPSQMKQELSYCSFGDSTENLDHLETSIKMEIVVDENVNYAYSTEDNIENDIPNKSNEIGLTVKHSKNKKVTSKRRKQPKTEKEKHTIEYNCALCTDIFSDRKLYLQHLVTHTHNSTDKSVTLESNENINQSLLCEVCSCPFKSIQSLSAHKKVHIAKDRILQCSICNKIFKKISHLKRHELSHRDNRPFKCTLCTKAYATEDSLSAHVNMHNGVKNHHCPVCMRMFCHLRTLTNHLKLHTREKPYLCPTCGKMFESSTNLNQHMKRHAGLKLFACNLCPKRFISKGELKAHGITHSGERSFKCNQCNGAFTKRSSLEKHKLMHLGVKPHQCDVCSMKFADKNHLKRHYRIHTGEKPYRCEICDRAFTQSNDLVKHKRTHLGNNLYKCDECNHSFRLKTELRQHISEHFISAQLQSKVAVNTELALTNSKELLEAVQ